MLLNANEGVLTSKKYFLMIVPKERQFLISCTDEWNCNKKKVTIDSPSIWVLYTHAICQVNGTAVCVGKL